MSSYGTWDATHEENASLAAVVQRAADVRGLELAHNVSSWSNFDGWHRYVVLEPGDTPPTIRAKRCLFYTQARFAKYFLPSISGESDALCELMETLLDRTCPYCEAVVGTRAPQTTSEGSYYHKECWERQNAENDAYWEENRAALSRDPSHTA